ncbi:MAG: hypothetical protein EOO03_00755 [Chitinophagaceae bacterium]|nr:MAG: hypothetical protein EOO03_00755 [Chitinophagaceae bacterium]
MEFLSVARASAAELQSQWIRCFNRHNINRNIC